MALCTCTTPGCLSWGYKPLLSAVASHPAVWPSPPRSHLAYLCPALLRGPLPCCIYDLGILPSVTEIRKNGVSMHSETPVTKQQKGDKEKRSRRHKRALPPAAAAKLLMRTCTRRAHPQVNRGRRSGALTHCRTDQLLLHTCPRRKPQGCVGTRHTLATAVAWRMTGAVYPSSGDTGASCEGLGRGRRSEAGGSPWREGPFGSIRFVMPLQGRVLPSGSKGKVHSLRLSAPTFVAHGNKREIPHRDSTGREYTTPWESATNGKDPDSD